MFTVPVGLERNRSWNVDVPWKFVLKSWMVPKTPPVNSFRSGGPMLAAALQMVAAFNLTCSGTVRSGPLGQALPEQEGEPFAITYRIDLGAQLWCSDACAATEAVASAIGEQIVLREQHHSAGSNVIIVTPAAGRFTDTLIDGDTATLRSGSCELAPFTGFLGRIA